MAHGHRDALPPRPRERVPREPSLVHPDDYADHGYPHDVWTRLRREDPVHWYDRTEGPPFWAITKHADIVEISKQPERLPERPDARDPARARASRTTRASRRR